jgi:hypothetical protein
LAGKSCTRVKGDRRSSKNARPALHSFGGSSHASAAGTVLVAPAACRRWRSNWMHSTTASSTGGWMGCPERAGQLHCGRGCSKLLQVYSGQHTTATTNTVYSGQHIPSMSHRHAFAPSHPTVTTCPFLLALSLFGRVTNQLPPSCPSVHRSIPSHSTPSSP